MPWSPSYATGAELGSWLGLEDTPPELAFATESASRAIDQATGRQFGLLSSSEFRWYTPQWWKDRWSVDIDDLMTEASLSIETEAGESITDYKVLPLNGSAKGQPWTRIEILPASPVQPRGDVKVAARWGWTNVPPAIKLSTLIQAGRWYDRKNSPTGVLTKGVVDDVELGWRAQRNELDDDVLAMVRPYRKLWVAV